MSGLEGRVALVTGGNRGVGGGISLALAEAGCDVAVNYRKDADSAREMVEAVEKLGRRAVAYQCPVDDFDGLPAMVDSILGDFGRIDILVNNAGVASKGSSVVDTPIAEMNHLLDVHALGPMRLCQLVVPQMRELDRGDIVMISSISAQATAPRQLPYSVAKQAMESLAITLSKEEKKHGIHVNIVAPGLVETEMGRRLVKATAGVTDMRQLDAVMPFGRVCQPADIAAAVLYLVSDSGGYVTGQRITVSGGQEQSR